MNDEDILDTVTDRIAALGFNPHTSPWPHKVFMMLQAAQGIIDNGGFEYFFESPFDGDPDMQEFPLVFDAVGATTSAATIREALSRSRLPDADFSDMNSVMWGESEQNYAMLAAYVRTHPEAFA